MTFTNPLKILKNTLLIALAIICYSCGTEKIEEINIGYIGPLSTRATDLGIGPSKAMQLAVEIYNANRSGHEPKVNLYIEDDQWEKDNALPKYNKLRDEHQIDILFISNTDGTIAVQDKILEDNVMLINPLNNDELLSSLNENTFKIAKSTEEANGLVANRIIDLNLKKVIIFHYPNDFMTRGAMAVKKLLDESGIENNIIPVVKGNIDFTEELSLCKAQNYDAYVMFGYKEFGFAQKQARTIGITARFYGSTTLLDPAYYTNSEGAIIGNEFPFFTPVDGNYILAEDFLNSYEQKFGEKPSSVWPPMQAYDAMNLVLNEIKNVNKTKAKDVAFGDWLRASLHKVKYYPGVCGNIAITDDGSSRGIYFSLYKYVSKNQTELVKRE